MTCLFYLIIIHESVFIFKFNTSCGNKNILGYALVNFYVNTRTYWKIKDNQ